MKIKVVKKTKIKNSNISKNQKKIKNRNQLELIFKDLKSLLAKCKTRNFLTYGFNKKANYQIVNVRKQINL